MIRNVPIDMVRKLRAEGVSWRDMVQEIAWATGRIFTFDGLQNAFYAARKAKRQQDKS